MHIWVFAEESFVSFMSLLISINFKFSHCLSKKEIKELRMVFILSLTLVLRMGRGCCNRTCQTAICNLYLPYKHLFTNMHRNLGVSYGWGGGSLQSCLVEVGGAWNSMILILTITKIFDMVYSCNACKLVCWLE